jgi:hypothetical protein
MEINTKYITSFDELNNNNTNSTAYDGHFWNDEWNVKDRTAKSYSYDCCANCPNNPANNPNATGICHCVLPSMEMIIF